MTEEINHATTRPLRGADSQPRFSGQRRNAVNWSVVNDNGAEATIALDPANAFNDKLTMSLRLTVTKAAKNHPAAWPQRLLGNSGAAQDQLPRFDLARAESIFPAQLRVHRER